MKDALAIATLVALFATTPSGQLSGIDARLGTWRLNLAKSRFDPAINVENPFDPAVCPLLPNQTLTYEVMPDGRVIVTAKRVDDDGRTTIRSATVITTMGRSNDETEFAIPGNPEAGSYRVGVLDDYHTSGTLRRGLTALQMVSTFVSPNRQTLRVRITDPATPGETVEIFDRQ